MSPQKESTSRPEVTTGSDSAPGVGHNSGAKPKKSKPSEGNLAAKRLRSIIERVERLTEERKALGSDISDIFAEAKGAGFDTKVIKTVNKIRALEPADVETQETLKDVYLRALAEGEMPVNVAVRTEESEEL